MKSETKVSILPVVFDKSAWTKAMKTIMPHDVPDFAEMFGISKSTLNNWRLGHYHAETPYPSMTNFIDICNWLDLNPQTFFIIDESEK